MAAMDASFAQGMHAALWPKVSQCHAHVGALLAAQEQLQETVDQLVAGLKDAELADDRSLVGYAERLRVFPERVKRLQKKLEAIDERLLTMKHANTRGSNRVTKQPVTPEAALLF